MNFPGEHTAILMLIVNEQIRSYMLNLCKEHNYAYLMVVDPDELIRRVKRLDSAVAFMDYEAVNSYGARIYSKVKVACPGCYIVLLSDRAHRTYIKEAMELGAYACILAPFQEWEVLSIIGNILAKKPSRSRKTTDDQGV